MSKPINQDERQAFLDGEQAAEARIVAWLKVTTHIGGRLAHINDSNLIARIAEAIERGEHRERK